MGGLRAGTTSASVASIFLQSQAGINPFAIASSTGTQLLTLTQAGALGLGTSTPSGLGITIERTGLSGTTTAGITQYLTFANSVASAQQFGNNTYMRTTNTATTTLVGSILRIEDSTTYGNTVRGLEVQTERGNNTLGENTAISGFARTFGVRGVTEGNAGATFEPAGVYGETRGTTQGNALRGYSSSITTAALLKLFQDTSTFTGTGLLMNFGNSGGSFSSTTASRFIDLQNAGTSRFTVGAYGMLTIGDGTMGTNAGIQIGYGGLCVDDDGSCNASTTGRISAEEYHTGNSDLAEMYFGDASLAAGEIVYLKGGLSIGKASQETADRIFGVISTKPGLLLGYDDSSLREGEVGHPIALSGRVPIKLSNENGPIKTGDELMLSSIPGVAMKASSTGVVVGIALEDFDETRAYSDTYINQFGENIIVPRFTPINQVTDPRINDGCYYGGGVAAGEAPCVPLQTETEDEQVAEANALAAAEAKADALAALALVPSETVTLAEREVQVGQIVMFVDLRYRYLDAESSTMLAALMATTTAANDAVETIWQRLVILAENFIDGVLSVFTLKADRVETKELCVDGVCVDAENLRTLLNQSAGTPVESTIETNDDEVVVTVIGGGEDTTATSTETGGDVVSPSAESDGNGTTTDAASTTEQTGAEPVVTEEGESEDIPAEDEPAEPLPEVVEEEQEVTEDETVRDEDGAQETENGGETAASTDGATVAE